MWFKNTTGNMIKLCKLKLTVLTVSAFTYRSSDQAVEKQGMKSDLCYDLCSEASSSKQNYLESCKIWVSSSPTSF